MKKRSLFWDNYKGILIFLVVLGHFLYAYATKRNGSAADWIFTIIYLFHMPAFIFASGYFSKSDNSRSAKSIVKLLLYYLVFNFGMMAFLYLSRGTSIKLLTPYNSYWYILSLIFWRLSIKHLSKIKGIVPLSVIIALLLGYYSDFTNVLSIRRTIVFFPFFLLGYKFDGLKVENFLEQREKWNKYVKNIIGFLVTTVILILLVFIVNKYNITLSMLLMGTYRSSSDILYRLFIFGVSIISIILLFFYTPNKEITFLTKLGKNSLLVYLIHRFITLIFAHYLPSSEYSKIYLIYCFIATVITCWVLSWDFLNRFVENIFNKVADILTGDSKLGQFFKTLLIIFVVLLLLLIPVKTIYNKISDSGYKEVSEKGIVDPLYLENTIKISYVGDLILLKDQVTSSYNSKTGNYDFDYMFEYAKPYLESSDLTIGVLEGPLAGNEVPFSTSNYGDGLKLYLNFPDEFAESIKDAGFDLVITANNHLLDRGVAGAKRTLDVLDKIGLKHVGSYRNQEEKDTLTIMEIDGVKIAFLSYLSSVNYYKTDNIFDKVPYITSAMPKENSLYYDEQIKIIEDDFKQAKEANVDLIVVSAHMGTQFKHSTNDFQDEWNEYFAELGADIILGDHAHAVQPVEYIDDTLVINCPGNFANSYIKYDGDATSIVNIYVDKNTKKIVASSIIPMYTHEMSDGKFSALPIYEIINNQELYSQLNYKEFLRVMEIQEIITDVMVNQKTPIEDAQEEYYLMNSDFYKDMTSLIDLNPDYKETEIYQLIDEADSIVFLGDSITEGTKNDNHPWYEYLMNDFKDKEIINISHGSYTTKRVLSNFSDDIKKTNADLYVIAVGTNDVRYRNEKICAMTSDEYVDEMEKIVELIKEENNHANIVLISPWMTLDGDEVSKLETEEKDEMIDEYSRVLERYASKNNYTYINPNPYLRSFLNDNDSTFYMFNEAHPNSFLGVILYSKAVYEGSN